MQDLLPFTNASKVAQQLVHVQIAHEKRMQKYEIEANNYKKLEIEY